ncbi:MAG: DUF721 domain-containing protein [Planctomycetaceae bacterium]|nr:DUF721 domain-containing protein [Planctomycetaceae bacterium]
METPPPARSRSYDTSEPSALGDVLSQLFSRRGYGQAMARRQLEDLWRKAAGEDIAELTKVITLRNGVLQIAVANSALLSELASFHKPEILAKLQAESKTEQINDVKFKRRGRL